MLEYLIVTIVICAYNSYNVQQIRQSHVHVNADQQLLQRLGVKAESIANILWVYGTCTLAVLTHHLPSSSCFFPL